MVLAMVELLDSLVRQCPGLPASLVEAHVRRMPESYLEGYSPAEIARHVRLLGRLTVEQPVEVDVRSLGGQSYEICVVGFDRTGILAAITTALASDGLDTLELRLATYRSDDENDSVGSARFVDVIRVISARKGWSVAEMSKDLRERLTLAFEHLAEGDLRSAQTAASESGSTLGGRFRTHHPPAAPWVVKEGLTLGDFRLERKLATGGMSEVYLATQNSLGRKAAVKIVACSAVGTADSVLARFQKEATVLGSFTSPHIVQVLASGTSAAANGTMLRWLAMEFLPNGDLASWVKRRGPPSAGIATRWLSQTLQGLQYAHHRGILHRDIKPHNLLLTSDWNAKISDFGLLKDAQQPEKELTMHGAVMGTPQYISPEQALAEPVDERSDIYSLGASFFYLLAGRPAFEEQSTTATLIRITQNDMPALLDVAPHVPRPLAVIVDRMVALRPEDRYQDVRVILEDLNSYVQRGRLTMAADDESAEQSASAEPPADMTQMYLPNTSTRPLWPSTVRRQD
jgi:serine/threonine protein kinase